MTDTITLPRSELQAALDALTNSSPNGHSVQETRDKAIQALRARLAQQEEKPVEDWEAVAIDKAIKNLRHPLSSPRQEEKPEPVAWWHDMGDVVDLNVSGRGVPLYTAPPRQEEKQDAPKESFVSMKEKPQAWMLITEAGACGGTFRYRVDVEVAARNLGGRFAIVPLYMSPPQREWHGLTDEEVETMFTDGDYYSPQLIARAIEAKLKEKNK